MDFCTCGMEAWTITGECAGCTPKKANPRVLGRPKEAPEDVSEMLRKSMEQPPHDDFGDQTRLPSKQYMKD